MDDGTTQSALRHCQRPPDLDKLMSAAADEIDVLRAALEPFAEPHPMGDAYVKFNPDLIKAARSALATPEPTP